jgi:hypothetical protein
MTERMKDPNAAEYLIQAHQQDSHRMASALAVWLHRTRSSIHDLTVFLRCDEASLARLALARRPTLHEDDEINIEIIVASLHVNADALRAILSVAASFDT